MKISAIITAGGTSSRYGSKNKLLEQINSKEIIKYTVEAFFAVNEIDEIVVCAHSSLISQFVNFFAQYSNVKVIEGGKTRQESVYNGLKFCSGSDYVLIHDGARPLISPNVIKSAVLDVQSKKALTVAVKTIDTIKQVDEDLKIIKTIDRTNLYNTQTPQAFDYNLILDAHERLKGQNFTDDAGMVEYLGVPVYILEGEYKNIKVTMQSDLEIAKIYL